MLQHCKFGPHSSFNEALLDNFVASLPAELKEQGMQGKDLSKRWDTFRKGKGSAWQNAAQKLKRAYCSTHNTGKWLYFLP